MKMLRGVFLLFDQLPESPVAFPVTYGSERVPYSINRRTLTAGEGPVHHHTSLPFLAVPSSLPFPLLPPTPSFSLCLSVSLPSFLPSCLPFFLSYKESNTEKVFDQDGRKRHIRLKEQWQQRHLDGRMWNDLRCS